MLEVRGKRVAPAWATRKRQATIRKPDDGLVSYACFRLSACLGGTIFGRLAARFGLAFDLRKARSAIY
ncbi:hypothetical protein K458DRAFT_415966 [Lentithecium fluviatile CBS 122367]|uniref:Uncharacterized protein n=1 Tax=Lentithecium fluviatile CBS 122367 TaxID=1168545 RepID=A0A6G1J874_9PLEO|nr:hypothetical protein K458DRAFT_415966 [Lentithecium fluviatile CBS 122367]